MNGSNALTYKWLTGILVAIVLALVAYVSSSLISDVNAIKMEHISGSQRLQALETNREETKARLDRLENKIDWLIRNQGGSPTQIVKTLE